MDSGKGVLEKARAYIREALKEEIEEVMDALILKAATDPKFSTVLIGLKLDLEQELLTTIKDECERRLSINKGDTV